MSIVKKLAPKLKIALPTKDNIPPENLDEYILMIYGQKGVGKTSLAAQFPDNLVFMFEKGRRNLKIRQVPGDGEPSLTWETFLEYVELFIESDQYKTAVIDTIDGCYLACFDSVTKRYGVRGDISPNVWDEIAAEFIGLIVTIKESGKGLIFLSHDKARPLNRKMKGLNRAELDDEMTISYDRLEPTCKPAAFRAIQEVCDFVFYYGYVDGYRAITVRSPHNTHWTSCGLGDHFLDPEGTPIEAFQVGKSPEAAYQNLLQAYDNKRWDVDYTPPPKIRPTHHMKQEVEPESPKRKLVRRK